MSVARPLVRALIPATNAFDQIKKLQTGVEALRETLTDPEISSYRLVVNPERIVIKEAQRAATYLSLFGYPIDGVVLNRVLPKNAVEGAFMEKMAELQTGYRQQVHDLFAPLPIWEAPHYPHDVTGVERLAAVGRALFKDADPTQIFFRGNTQEIVKDGQDYMLRLPLPHVEIGKVGITKRGDELFITIGNFKRDMILPLTLAERPATRAVFKDGVLEVRFGPPEAPQQ